MSTLSGLAGDALHVSDALDRAQVQAAADEAMPKSYNTVRASAYPGYLAIDTSWSDLGPAMGATEATLGSRPLSDLEVDALFDPVTGSPL